MRIFQPVHTAQKISLQYLFLRPFFVMGMGDLAGPLGKSGLEPFDGVHLSGAFGFQPLGRVGLHPDAESLENRENQLLGFCFSQYLAGAVSLFPVKSLVDNSAGFDGEGTNCRKFTRFRFELDTDSSPEFRFPARTKPDRRITRRALWYHSLPIRFYSLIMYQFER